MRGEDCRQAKIQKLFLLFSSVVSPFSMAYHCATYTSIWCFSPIHPSSSSLVQSWPCTKRHFWFGCEALSFPSTNRELIGWVRRTPAMTRTLPKIHSVIFYSPFLFFFPKFFPTPHRAPFTADTEKKKNVERKSIYVTRQVSESLFPVIFTVNTSTFNSLKLTRFVIFIRWIFRVCEGGPPPLLFDSCGVYLSPSLSLS